MPLQQIMETLAADTRHGKGPLEPARAAWRDREGKQIVSRSSWFDAKRRGYVDEATGLALVVAAAKLNPAICGIAAGRERVYYLPSFAGAYAAEKARADALEATLWKLLHAGRAL